MKTEHNRPRKIAIVGAGFTGVALVAALHRYALEPISVYLYEKTGKFGAGDAYRTPFPYHLLNARVNDMSAIEDDADHFLSWLSRHPETHQYLESDSPLPRQFVPRILYFEYLNSLLDEIREDAESKVTLHARAAEVVDLLPEADRLSVVLADGSKEVVDEVILALGNNPPANLPFTIPEGVAAINNPWDYTALREIPSKDPVMIVGTGLSMVDAVMTLYQQKHQGKIYAVSRRGLIPLPHTENCMAIAFDCASLPEQIVPLTRAVRTACNDLVEKGGDWRNIIQHMRLSLVDTWLRLNEKSRKQFLRHVLPYWNIHRHRVHEKLHGLLVDLQKKGQLEIIAGRIQGFIDDEVQVKKRVTHQLLNFPVRHVINCMGSSFDYAIHQQTLLSNLFKRDMMSLDGLRLGLAVTPDYKLVSKSGNAPHSCYTLGPPMRGELWECIAVPEIRKQCKELAGVLLNRKKMDKCNEM